MKNKFISFILCALIVLPSFPAVTTQASEWSSPIKVLSAMNVMTGDPDGNMREQDFVTRAEFAKMAVLLSEYKNQVSHNMKISVFSDCTASHWASPYVKVAVENSILRGYSSGIFAPSDNITYAQALTVALRLLGYTDEDFSDSYPAGQISKARALNLDNFVLKTANDVLTRKEVAQIFVNMLTAKSENTQTDYISKLGYTFLEDCIIIATRNEDSSVASGKVLTSEGEYDISDSFDLSFVGKKGTALVTREGRLEALFENNFTVSKYALYSVSTDFLGIYNSGRVTTLSCDDDTVFYSNGKKTNFASVRSSLSTGDFLTVATSSDNKTEYVIATQSDFDGPYTAQKDAVLPSHINPSNVSVIKNGERSSLSEIKKNDIIYYSPSLSTVFDYSKKVRGIYTSAIPNKDSVKSVTVGANTYTIESVLAFSKLCSEGTYDIGDHIVLLLGQDGGVADVLGEKETDFDTEHTLAVSEIKGKSAENALLEAIGAITLSNGELTAENEYVKRGEFAKMAVMSSEFGKLVSLGSRISVYPDATADYWATPYIKVAVENSLMSAFSNGRFQSEDCIEYAHVLDTCLKMLGYTSQDLPDFGLSQISVAKSLGITDTINKNANDYVTKKEAVKILYNTLNSVRKNDTLKVIETLDYKYYESCVLMAGANDSPSVSSGKIATSVGTFSIDENFDTSLIGKTGELLVLSDKIIMFNPKSTSFSEATVHSAVNKGLALMTADGIKTLSLSDNTSVYIGASKQTYAQAKDKISMGDSALISYDEKGIAEYVYINNKALKGPYLYKSADWYKTVSGASAKTKIMKDGKIATSFSVNDIIYYSPSLDTAFAYDDKVTGIFEDASPSKSAPDTVTVSGKTYTLSSVGALPTDIEYGDTLTLCLGRDKSAVYGYVSDSKVAGYLVSTGVKEFQNSNDETYTSRYARLVLADGSEIDCATDVDYSKWINSVMNISFLSGKAKLSQASKDGNIIGQVNAQTLSIGSKKVSPDVKILDVGYNDPAYPTVYTSVYLSRLDNMSLSGTDVLYSKSENGVLTELILKDVTGDAFSYGIVMSAKTDITQTNASGSYTLDIGGKTYSYSGGAVTNISKGSVVKTALSQGRISYLSKLTPKSVNIKECDYTSITDKDGKTYLLASDVVVYKLGQNSNYTILGISELYDNFDKYSYCSVYTDRDSSKGGRVRIIILK